MKPPSETPFTVSLWLATLILCAVAFFLFAGCAYLKRTWPDDVCLKPCQAAIGVVDLYELDQKTAICACYRWARDGDPGDFEQVSVK